MNAKMPKGNGLDAASLQSARSAAQRSRLRRTLFTAGVFALLAMIFVPMPNYGGYRLIFSASDTSIAFFQLLVNVGFAAIAGAITANMSKRALYVTGGCIALVAAAWFTYDAWDKNARRACNRADWDEKYADELMSHAGWWQTSAYAHANYSDQQIANQIAACKALAKKKRLLAADNWHIALDFVKEKRARERAPERNWRPNPFDQFDLPVQPIVRFDFLPDQTQPEVSPRQRAPFDPSTATLIDEASPRLGSPSPRPP